MKPSSFPKNSSYRYNFLQPLLKHLLLEAIDPIKNYSFLYFRTLFGVSVNPRNVVESVLAKRTQDHPESTFFDTVAAVLSWILVEVIALVSLPFRLLFGILRELKLFIVAVSKQKTGAWAADAFTRLLLWFDFQLYLISELLHWLVTPIRKLFTWLKKPDIQNSLKASVKESLRVGVDKRYYNPVSFMLATIGLILLVLYLVLRWQAPDSAPLAEPKVGAKTEQLGSAQGKKDPAQDKQETNQEKREKRLKASMDGMIPIILAGNGQDALTPEQLVGVRKLFLFQFELEGNENLRKFLLTLQSFFQILIFSYVAKSFFRKESFNGLFVLGFYCISIVLLSLQLADLMITVRHGWVQSKELFRDSMISYLLVSILLPIVYYFCYFVTAPKDDLLAVSQSANVEGSTKRVMSSLGKTLVAFALAWLGSWLPIGVFVSYYLDVPLIVILTI